MNQRRAVIVGGGVIGIACSHYLHQAGFDVTIVDQGRVGSACSHANCGYVSPSHALPLAGPGMIVEGLKNLFRKEAPLAIRWRYDPALWQWLFRFVRRCNPHDMWQSARAINAILESSRKLYGQLFECTPIQAEWSSCGLMFVFQSQRGMDHYAHVDHSLRNNLGLGAERIDGPRLQQMEPALVGGLAGAWLYHNDAQLRPDQLLASWRKLVVANGVVIREQHSFRGFKEFGQKVAAVHTDRGDFPADVVVMATGSWTPLLHRILGVKVPIQPGKGYSITMARPPLCPTLPMIFEEHRTAITPFADRFRIGSTMEFAGYDNKLSQRRLQMLKNNAAIYMKTPTAEPTFEEWWGWRPMVFDGRPIIGPIPKYSNVLIAAGHGMLGLSMATGTGRLVTELVTGTKPHINAEPFSVKRF